jgi:oxygen-independent coproporphyrinogen-3 oxidase
VSSEPVGLYLHIPFCAVRCPYCDFNTYSGLESFQEGYTRALIAEIRAGAEEHGRRLAHTVFVGGGTPTALPAALLAQILDALQSAFEVDEGGEITSEANPGTTDLERFSALRDAGVNRLSMGVQSFDDAELRWLGRIHSAAEAETAFEHARRAGFDNVNLDLMFGLPGQSHASWLTTVRRALSLQPEHLSLYGLTVEEGTPLARQVRAGEKPAPDDDAAADMYLAASDLLGRAGLQQYEISNWSRGPELRCRHNLRYWRREPYLGFGAGAHSFLEERRWWNVRPIPEYIALLDAGRSAEGGGEQISRAIAMVETMMLGLRLVQEGVAEADFLQQYGVALQEAFGPELADLRGRQLLECDAGRWRLTPQARLLGNQVFGAFL